ncbi:MAG: heavy-metal-associated domain-containing protein [Crocinitomicaceae bacterium]|nr:heavy-metal-associated domain-containing protein [Crocinitomicaceae bacterium]
MYYLKIFLVALLFIQSSGCVGQAKYTESNFEVKGVCGMCEHRIENALDLKGIKLADWDLESKKLRVIFKNSMYTELEIHEILAAVGHATDKVKVTKTAYDKLHKCCKYE